MTIFLVTLLLIAASIVYWSVKNGISPMPSSPKAKKTLEALLPKEVNGTILELGSGWGTLAVLLSQAYPEYSVLAYETSPVPYFFSRFRSKENLTFVRKDFF